MTDWLLIAGIVCGALGVLGATVMFLLDARAQAALVEKEAWNRWQSR